MSKMKGQLMSHPFIVIFSLIVMGLILVFGAKSIYDLKKAADLSELAAFVKTFQDQVAVYYNLDVGSSKILSVVVPQKIEAICFVNPGETITNKQEDPFFMSILEDNKRDNMYLSPLGAYPAPAPDFMIEHLRVDGKENPLCIQIQQGKLQAVIATMSGDKEVFVAIRRK